MSTTMNAGPETINRIADGAYPALAMLAGMQLDLFTPLEHGPMTAEEIRDGLGTAWSSVLYMKDLSDELLIKLVESENAYSIGAITVKNKN